MILEKAGFLKNIFITFSHIGLTYESLISKTITAVVNLPYELALKQLIQ